MVCQGVLAPGWHQRGDTPYATGPAQAVVQPRPTRTKHGQVAVGRLCCRFGRHTLTRFSTLSTHLNALLYHLIIPRQLFTILSALLTQLGTDAAYLFMKLGLPKHVIDSYHAHLRAVHE